MSVTSTDTIIAAPTGNSIRSLGTLIDSLSPPRQRNSHISKVYKQASTQFLTRDFTEAFSTLQPILNRPDPSEDAPAGDDLERLAPIATASRSLRIKVWSLYLTLINAIIELGPGEGKAALGSKQWCDMAAKTRDGTIWDEVVQVGYDGVEGDVDADVVTNLATLLLSHSASQATNQEHLETYLATSDLPNGAQEEASGSPTSRQEHSTTVFNGTNTPRALASRLKILELYILHVLPANSQWEYAKEFISINSALDDERKELFQQALEALEAEKLRGDQHEEEQEHPSQALKATEDLSQDLQQAEPIPFEDSSDHHTPKHRRSNSEQDYGIEDAHQMGTKPKSSLTRSSGSSARTAKPSQQRNKAPSPSSKISPRKQVNNSIIQRSRALIAALQSLISNMTQSMSRNPLALLRFVLFVVVLVVALSRRDVKERIGRMWEKVKETVGMGVRVNYI
ncbi:MAG: hypothetical protein Q9201_002223 [Fulgogasparrea decipioides]